LLGHGCKRMAAVWGTRWYPIGGEELAPAISDESIPDKWMRRPQGPPGTGLPESPGSGLWANLALLSPQKKLSNWPSFHASRSKTNDLLTQAVVVSASQVEHTIQVPIKLHLFCMAISLTGARRFGGHP
jgi:hypothetical protein